VATSLPVTLYFISTGSPTLLSLGNCHITTLLRAGPILPASSNPMCALLIVMIIIIVVSGIIVFAVIISVKYFNEDNADKIGPALKSVVIWQLPKDNNVGEPVEIKYKVTGKDVATMLDTFNVRTIEENSI
jgi:hypothetical protein